MLAQRTLILAALSARGWKLVGTVDGAWWADEILVLESEWSPSGRQTFLTFLVDPQHEGPRQQGESVWAVAASQTKPTERLDATRDPMLSLGRGWHDRLPEFVQQLDAFRQ